MKHLNRIVPLLVALLVQTTRCLHVGLRSSFNPFAFHSLPDFDWLLFLKIHIIKWVLFLSLTFLNACQDKGCH